MVRLIFAFFDHKQKTWEFFDEDKKSVSLEELQEIKNKKLCVILPDECIYFFQTNIEAKKRLKEIILAYVKNTFLLEQNFFLGYLKDVFPVIGYLLKKQDVDTAFLKEAFLITTPFLVKYVLHIYQKSQPFIYSNGSITAIVDENKRLIRYFHGEAESISNHYEYKLIYFDKMDLIEDLCKLFKSRKKVKKLLHLDIADKPYISIKKCVYTTIIMFTITLLCFIGNYLKYSSYANNLNQISTKIENIYNTVFNGKKYIDPYGMLLYKAKICNSDNSLSPIKLLFTLSKAKEKDNIKIDFIAYKDNVYNIKGKAEDYEEVVDYINKLKKLNLQAKILNTAKELDSNKKILKFELLCK